MRFTPYPKAHLDKQMQTRDEILVDKERIDIAEEAMDVLEERQQRREISLEIELDSFGDWDLVSCDTRDYT